MDALLRKPTEDEAVGDSGAGTAEEQAADIAVRPVAQRVMDIGGSPEQGAAVAEAMRLILLRGRDYASQARRTLMKAGFVETVADQMIFRMEQSLSPDR
jgi:hypothetical protein